MSFAAVYEFWHALGTLKVPTQLIIYPGEGHLFLKPQNQSDRMDQTVAGSIIFEVAAAAADY